MHLLLVGLFAVALSNQVFRKSEEFCPYGQTTYIKVSASSVISCAVNCDKDKGGCSRFVYDADQEECTMYRSIEGIVNEFIDTSTGGTLFLSSRKGCSLGYDFDSQINTCIKVNNNVLSWHDARERCQADGGDLVTMETREKWEFVTRFIECTTDAFWIGLWNTTWLSGSIFDNLYGLHTSKILHESEPSNSCAGLRFNAGNPYIIRSVACINATKSLCELPIPP